MFTTFARSICAGLLFAGFVKSVMAGGGAPSVIYMKSDSRIEPVWISAKAATGQHGVRWELFAEADQRTLGKFLADSEQRRAELKSATRLEFDIDCPLVLSGSEPERIGPKPNGSLADLDQQALAIYRGRIETIASGFFDGLPSSLLAVEVTKVHRSSARVARGTVLIPYPFAKFKVGASTFCGGDPKRYQPAVGDQVLVFIYDEPLNVERTLLLPRSAELFFQTAAGRLIVPEALKTDKAVTAVRGLSELEKRLRWGS
jgi:hypothetical protein